MNIREIQQEIIDLFEPFDDWMDRYALIIDMAKELDPLDEREKVPDNIIEGCQSRVWIVAKKERDLLYFKADSDALIVKGIAAMLLRIFNGQKPEDILREDLFFIKKIGLDDHLSPTRSNGLHAMIDQIKRYALKSIAHLQE